MNNTKININQYSSDILKYINFFKEDVTKKILNSEKYKTEKESYFFVVVQKILFYLEGSNIFICNFYTHPEFHIPLFINLRAIINDVITTECLIYKSKLNTDLDETYWIKTIYSEHLKFKLGKPNLALEKIINGHSKEYVNKSLINIAPQLFNEEGGLLYNEGFKSNKIMEEIFSSTKKNDSRYDILRASYNLYDKFSKFEHLGIFTNSLLFRGYDMNTTKSSLIKDLIYSINITVSALNNYIKIWEGLNFDYDKINNISSKILSHYKGNH